MGGERRSPRTTRWTQRVQLGCFLCVLGVLGVLGGDRVASAQEPAAPEAVSQATLNLAIDNLGKLDYTTRTKASLTIRRTPASQAVPALVQAARTHEDGYVKYRALVLLTGFNDPGTEAVMREARTSVNDRLRTVAYEYFEHHPDPSMVPELLTSLDKEDAEFVRPSLVRALAALGSDARVSSALVRETGRGEDFFRSAVIEALGDYKAAYAIDALTAIARQDGPLLDDSALALGKIGDSRALETLAALQRTGSPALQPIVAASTCLLSSAVRRTGAISDRYAQDIRREWPASGNCASGSDRPRSAGPCRTVVGGRGVAGTRRARARSASRACRTRGGDDRPSQYAAGVYSAGKSAAS